ncbi:MAG: peptidoglycan DD-metalloendopeptidase family protein [Nitrospiria bacterium]
MRKEKTLIRKIGIALGSTCLISLFYFGNRFLTASEPAVDPAPPMGFELPHTEDPSALETLPLASPPIAPLSPLVETATSSETLAQDISQPAFKEYVFKKGDVFYSILSKFGLEDREIYEITKISKPIYDLRKILPGQKIEMSMNESPDQIDAISVEIDFTRRLIISRSEGGWAAQKEEIRLDREIASGNGVIVESLYESALRAGIPREVILNLSDIFAWDLDFGVDIRRGDRFTLSYEVFKNKGETVRFGRVLAAKMMNRGKMYQAYYFAPDGDRGSYYDENGRSMKKAFLRSPLRYRYISSGYTRRRLHPILKVNRPHLGIDFAAKHGTPVRAASDGVVSFVGWKGGLGKTIIIRHRNGYKTLYGHLSSFWRGIKKGRRVKQEDFIGRVGSTGLSTGPHLHYTLIKNGRAINPRKADVLRGKPLPPQWRDLFEAQVDKMNLILEPLTDPLSESNET